MAKDIIMAEQLMNLTYRMRKYATYTSKMFVPMPSHMCEEDLLDLFSPLQDYIQKVLCTHTTPKLIQSLNSADSSQESMLKKQVTQIGAIISVQWSTSEVGDLGWKPGWYKEKVHGYCEETDTFAIPFRTR